jgi:hypothetical protein
LVKYLKKIRFQSMGDCLCCFGPVARQSIIAEYVVEQSCSTDGGWEAKRERKREERANTLISRLCTQWLNFLPLHPIS